MNDSTRNSTLPRVWVDFNEIERGHTDTLLAYADQPITISQNVVTYDGDGNTCQGIVRAIKGKIADIELDMNTFVPNTTSSAVETTISFTTDSYFNGLNYKGHVYANNEIVFTFTAPIKNFPAGIEDFNGILARKFARKLSNLLGEEEEK